MTFCSQYFQVKQQNYKQWNIIIIYNSWHVHRFRDIIETFPSCLKNIPKHKLQIPSNTISYFSPSIFNCHMIMFLSFVRNLYTKSGKFINFIILLYYKKKIFIYVYVALKKIWSLACAILWSHNTDRHQRQCIMNQTFPVIILKSKFWVNHETEK